MKGWWAERQKRKGHQRRARLADAVARRPDVQAVLRSHERGAGDLLQFRERLEPLVPEDSLADQALSNTSVLSWYFARPDPERFSLDESIALAAWIRTGAAPSDWDANPTLTSEQGTRLISGELADLERAIAGHPAATARLYHEAASAHREGLQRAEPTNWSESFPLSFEQLQEIHKYLFAAAFVAAWWEVRGDSRRSTTATSTASVLTAAAGFDPDEAARIVARYQAAFLRQLQLANMSEG